MADGLRLAIADESNALFQGMIVTFHLISRIFNKLTMFTLFP